MKLNYNAIRLAYKKDIQKNVFFGGDRGIRTLAPLAGPNSLANCPLRPTWVCLLKKFSGLLRPLYLLGGEGGIRTHGTLTRTPIFKTGALNQLDHLSVSRYINITLVFYLVNIQNQIFSFWFWDVKFFKFFLM